MRLCVAVLGAGSWGSTVAALASHNAPVCVWARRPELAQEINDRRTNQLYLTRQGRKVVRRIRRVASEMSDNLTEGLPGGDLRQLERGLLHIRAVLKDA